MSFFHLVSRELQVSLPRLMFMSALAGISNATLLAAINSGSQAAGKSDVSLWAATLFVVSLLIFIKSQHYLLIVTTAEIEQIIHTLRVRLMDGVRHSELLPLEAIGRARVVAAITKDTAMLTQAANTLAFAGQGLILLVFIMLYIAYLSFLAFALTVLVVGFAAIIFHAKSQQLAEGMAESANWENRLFDRLSDLMEGFKEVRLNRARSEDLYDDISEVSRMAANIKIATQAEQFKRMVFSQSTMYILLAVVVFAVPVMSSTSSEAITQTTTALLFVVGACFGLVQSIPILTAANAAADNINRLDAQLRGASSAVDVASDQLPKRFEQIEMRSIRFQYVDEAADVSFRVGPVDFTLRSGELVFIMGGNGSGKSTLVKVLAGLYTPDSGEIILDGKRIDNASRDHYRGLLTAIFSDYHLFHRLYGIPDPDRDEVSRLLTEYKLAEKTHLTNGEFQTLNLSAGQRKRLALIVSLLEQRPILLLDEWAADQDPEFRHKFYHEILPALKRAGKTLVVVTHDERYVDELDIPARRIYMDEGRIAAEKTVEDQR
jgi:putative pyoverdin transport system ATP-binding/permease protein